jgi:hypothetical protein|tara:strand:- start:106 stop:627 length:522 start_codon:yes stop_codon:yes gene_type:complete
MTMTETLTRSWPKTGESWAVTARSSKAKIVAKETNSAYIVDCDREHYEQPGLPKHLRNTDNGEQDMNPTDDKRLVCERCNQPVDSNPARPSRHPRTLAELKADPRIDEVWREDDGCWPGVNAYWASLAEGWRWEECITLHEPTVECLLEALKTTYTGCAKCDPHWLVTPTEED